MPSWGDPTTVGSPPQAEGGRSQRRLISPGDQKLIIFILFSPPLALPLWRC